MAGWVLNKFRKVKALLLGRKPIGIFSFSIDGDTRKILHRIVKKFVACVELVRGKPFSDASECLLIHIRTKTKR